MAASSSELVICKLLPVSFAQAGVSHLFFFARMMPTCAYQIFPFLLLATCHLLSFSSGDYVWVGREGWKWQEDSKSFSKSEGAVRRSVQPAWIEGSGEEGSLGDMDDEDALEGTGLGEELDLLPSLILDPISTSTPDPVEIEDSSAAEIPLIVSADFNRVRVEWMPPLDGDISVDSSDSLKLSWDLPSCWRQADTSRAVAIDGEGTGVVGYQVLYAPSSSWDQPSSRMAVNTKDREFLLSNLERDARYTLRVSAVVEPFPNIKPNQSLFFTNRPVPMQVGVTIQPSPPEPNFTQAVVPLDASPNTQVFHLNAEAAETDNVQYCIVKDRSKASSMSYLLDDLFSWREV